MKNLLFTAFISSVFITAHAQNASPCKVVTRGMKQSEVLKLCGNPTERDTIGRDENIPGGYIIIWQYGKVGSDGNQRVQFNGDYVSDVVSNGKKYDELLAKLKSGDLKSSDLEEEINRMNKENCR